MDGLPPSFLDGLSDQDVLTAVIGDLTFIAVDHLPRITRRFETEQDDSLARIGEACAHLDRAIGSLEDARRQLSASEGAHPVPAAGSSDPAPSDSSSIVERKT